MPKLPAVEAKPLWQNRRLTRCPLGVISNRTCVALQSGGTCRLDQTTRRADSSCSTRNLSVLSGPKLNSFKLPNFGSALDCGAHHPASPSCVVSMQCSARCPWFSVPQEYRLENSRIRRRWQASPSAPRLSPLCSAARRFSLTKLEAQRDWRSADAIPVSGAGSPAVVPPVHRPD
jgi:hypothetical protein